MKLVTVAVTATTLAVIGAATASSAADSSRRVDVIVALAPGAPLAPVARNADLAVGPALIASRNVHVVSAWARSTEAKDLERAAKDAVNALRRDARVEWTEAVSAVKATDERFHAWPSGAPDEANASALVGQAAFADLELAQTHALATGRGVLVAVLDTGVDAAHELLAGSLAPGYDMIDDDADPSEIANGTDDDRDGATDRAFGHGTFVAGLVRQVAPDAQILPVRVLDDEGRGGLAAIVEGIEYAIESGAKVINLSLGIAGKVGLAPVKDVLKRARKAGVIVIAAAGNEGDRTELFPAAEKDVVAVTALSADGRALASFANRGKWVDVAAPGVDLVSSVPNGRYARWGGSSMSVGVVSGQIALMAERYRGDSVKDLESVLWKTCRRIGKDTEHGVIDALAAISSR